MCCKPIHVGNESIETHPDASEQVTAMVGVESPIFDSESDIEVPDPSSQLAHDIMVLVLSESFEEGETIDDHT